MILLNGNSLHDDKIISLQDRGFTYGDGIFTTCLVKNGLIDDWDLHYERLNRHAHSIHLPPLQNDIIDHSLASLSDYILVETMYSLKIIYTRGNSARGLDIPKSTKPNIFMLLKPIDEISNQPLRVMISTTTRRNEFSKLSNIKSLNYLDNILAKEDAKKHGADDSIMLSTKGFVSCATSSNVFIVDGKDWITPPLTDGAMDGIERYKLIQKGAREESITPQRLRIAQKIILTNSIWKQREALII